MCLNTEKSESEDNYIVQALHLTWRLAYNLSPPVVT